MSVNKSVFIGGWFAVVAIGGAIALLLGYSFSTTTGLLMAALACVPPFIAQTVFRGAPERSTVELIYDAENTAPSPKKRP